MLLPNGKRYEAIIANTPNKSVQLQRSQFLQLLKEEAGQIRGSDPRLHGQSSFESLMRYALRNLRDKVKRTLPLALDEIRKNQPPEIQKNYFSRMLCNSVMEELSERLPNADLSKYKVRFFTAVDTVVDHALGTDFFVDLARVNKDGKESSLGEYYVDLTHNDEKGGNSSDVLTDFIFHYDPKDIAATSNAAKNVSNNLILSKGFGELVGAIADEFEGLIQIKYHKN